MNKRKDIYVSCVFGFLVLISFRINLLLDEADDGKFLRLLKLMGVQGGQIEDLLLYFGLVGLIYVMLVSIRKRHNDISKDMRRPIYSIIPGVILALGTTVGKVIEECGTLAVVCADIIQVGKFLIAFLGYGFLFSLTITYLFYLVDNVCISEQLAIHKSGFIYRFLSWIEKRPFWNSFIFLCIMYLPYIIVSYPGIVQGDGKSMIPQGFNVPEMQSNMLVLLDPDVVLNNHHPVIYTLFIHVCLVIGKTIFDSYNFGLFFVCIIQFLFATFVISYLIDYLVSIRVNSKIVIGVLLYYIFVPRIQAYMFLLSKDVFYGFFMLFLVVFLVKNVLFGIVDGESTGEAANDIGRNKLCITIMLSACMLILLRNEGKYVVILWFLILACMYKAYRKMITGALVLLAFSLVLNSVIMPYFKITPGSVREMLSVPFQQTARCVLYHADEVTESERQIIDKVLIYDTLAERYVPDNADPVKNEYNKYATKEDLSQYFRVWYGMLKKYPMTYVDATVNNYFNYFYFGKKYANNYSYRFSRENMDYVNDELQSEGMNLHYPDKLAQVQRMYELARENIFRIPILNLFKTTALYVWMLVVTFFYLVWSKKKRVVCLIIPMIFCLGAALMGPRNGEYFRYAYILAVCMPAIMIVGLAYKRIIFDRID